jgi:hypothetical protein
VGGHRGPSVDSQGSSQQFDLVRWARSVRKAGEVCREPTQFHIVEFLREVRISSVRHTTKFAFRRDDTFTTRNSWLDLNLELETGLQDAVTTGHCRYVLRSAFWTRNCLVSSRKRKRELKTEPIFDMACHRGSSREW